MITRLTRQPQKYIRNGREFTLKELAQDFKDRSQNVNLTIYRVLKDAGIVSNTYYLWKSGKIQKANIDSLNKIDAVLETYEIRH
jgi:hypothetical protein